MKNFLIIAAAAGTVLASCAKTETVEVSDAKYIGFDSAWIGNPTKAVEEVTTDNIKSFYVYGGYDGTQEFNQVTVAPNTNGEWTYSPLVPWTDSQIYNFYAYSGVDVTPTYDYTNGLTFTDVTVNNTINQTDFIYAERTNIASEGEGTVRDKVQFTFDHLFSMVQFTIKSGFPKDVKLQISDFELYGLMSTASFNASGTEDKWTTNATDQLNEDSGIELQDGSAQATDPSSTDYVDNCVVMPQTFTDNTVKAKFTVTAPTSESIDPEVTKVITALIPADTWEKGYRYNYIVTIDGQTLDFITFDAPIVNKWTVEDINMVNDETTSGQVVVDNQGN